MAKRFTFRLQPLLDVRELHEREAKRRVAAKGAEIARLDQLNEQTVREILRQQEYLLAAQQTGQLNPLDLQRGRAWIAHLRKTIGVRQAQKAGLQEELRVLQEQLREARTQTRIIEKLRQRRWNEYADRRDKQEQAAADELAQQLHVRQSLNS